MLQKWSRAPHWRPEEGVALAFGLEPSEVVEARFYDRPRLRASDAIKHFAELARRALDAGDLPERPRPLQFIAWAKRVGLRFHEQWEKAVGDGASVGPDRRSETVRETVRRTAKEVERRDTLIKQWALAPSWTHAEGAALSLNHWPELFEDVVIYRDPLELEFKRRHSFAHRAHAQSQLNRNPTPAEFVSWAATAGLPFDKEWIEAVGEPSPPGALNQTPGSTVADKAAERAAKDEPPMRDPPLHARTRDNMLRLIIGMAIDAYGYDPRARRNTAAREIADELAKLDIQITAETVRRYLDDAAQLISGEALRRKFEDE